MNILQLLSKEMQQEAAITRKMLERVPADKFDWKPHEKSMSMQQLTTHIAELPQWAELALTTDGIDFATMDYTPAAIKSTQDLLDLHEKSLEKGTAEIGRANEEMLWEQWTMRTGEHIISVTPKYDVIRIAIAQTIHHRAQLGVYLRLLNIPIPGSYGPSADEPNF